MNRYKFHHNVLTFLKEEFYKYDPKGETSKYCFDSKQIAEKFKIDIHKSENILFELNEFECVDFNKNWGFKISENGIKKQLTKFFIYKKNENLKLNIKEIIQIIIPIFSLFVALSAIFYKVDTLNNENKKEIRDLKKRIEYLETKKNKV